MMVSPFSPNGAPGIAIERASLEHADNLAHLASALFEQTFGPANTPEDMAAYVADAFSPSQQRRELADARNRIWLARDAVTGSLVGYAHVRLDAAPRAAAADTRSAEIARLYADRDWHGRGLGGALMHMCIETAREHGARLLWLGVWEHNQRAIAFYEKHGFRVIGEQPFVLGTDRQRDLVMALDLTRPG